MKLSRDITIKIKFVLDELLPPIIRDSDWFMELPLKLILGNKSNVFKTFKDNAPFMTQKQFSDVYEEINAIEARDTDLNNACIEEILKNISGKKVLEVGCGRGLLADKMAQSHEVIASDIVIDKHLPQKYPRVTFKKADIEKLPFKDNEFDTIVSTHTLEHVQNIFHAISELRRVAKKRIILVVPKQRPYKFTFDLHIHFFPYPHSLQAIMGNKNKSICKEVGGDLFYMETKNTP